MLKSSCLLLYIERPKIAALTRRRACVDRCRAVEFIFTTGPPDPGQLPLQHSVGSVEVVEFYSSTDARQPTFSIIVKQQHILSGDDDRSNVFATNGFLPIDLRQRRPRDIGLPITDSDQSTPRTSLGSHIIETSVAVIERIAIRRSSQSRAKLTRGRSRRQIHATAAGEEEHRAISTEHLGLTLCIRALLDKRVEGMRPVHEPRGGPPAKRMRAECAPAGEHHG